MDDQAVLVERRGPVTVLTLNRPNARNAINGELATALGSALEAAERDPDVRVVVLTGAGSAFCAGADLKAMIQPDARPLSTDHPEWGFAGFVRHPLAKPVIAAVNGPAMGGGTEVVLTCDLAIASDRAMFGLPEVKRGIVAAAGGLVRLPRQVPEKVAMLAALTGRHFTATEVLGWGLVNDVVPHDELLDRAIALAEEIAANAPLAVQQSKRVLRRHLEGRPADETLAWELTQEARALVGASEDAREGAVAFAEKRPAVWRGR